MLVPNEFSTIKITILFQNNFFLPALVSRKTMGTPK